MVYNIQPCKYTINKIRHDCIALMVHLNYNPFSHFSPSNLQCNAWNIRVFKILKNTAKQWCDLVDLSIKSTKFPHRFTYFNYYDVSTYQVSSTSGHNFQHCQSVCLWTPPCVKPLGGQLANYGHFNLIIKLSYKIWHNNRVDRTK